MIRSLYPDTHLLFALSVATAPLMIEITFCMPFNMFGDYRDSLPARLANLSMSRAQVPCGFAQYHMHYNVKILTAFCHHILTFTITQRGTADY